MWRASAIFVLLASLSVAGCATGGKAKSNDGAALVRSAPSYPSEERDNPVIDTPDEPQDSPVDDRLDQPRKGR
jgi:hypothetical protein